MGSQDSEQNPRVKYEQDEKIALKTHRLKADKEFERLKNEKLGRKENETSDAAKLEWIELSRELQIDKDTGRPYHLTTAEKSRKLFIENPLIPLGKYFGKKPQRPLDPLPQKGINRHLQALPGKIENPGQL